MMDGRGSARVVVGVVHTEDEGEEGCAPWDADTPAPQWAATGAAGERAAEDFLVPTLEGLLRVSGTPDCSSDDDAPLAVVLVGADAGVQCRAARACLRAVLAARAVPAAGERGRETPLPRTCTVAYRVVDSTSTAATAAHTRANE